MGTALLTTIDSQQFFSLWVQKASQTFIDNADKLTELDSAIGDGDHGINMRRGAKALQELSCHSCVGSDGVFDVGMYVKKIGMALVSHVGGASGPLYGTFFLRMAQSFQKNSCGNELSVRQWVDGLEAGVGGIEQRGKASYGEKTMLDVWKPVVEALCTLIETNKSTKDSDTVSFPCLMQHAYEVARREADATIDRKATKGRASYLGERSRGTMDPGAASSLMWIKAAYDCLHHFSPSSSVKPC